MSLLQPAAPGAAPRAGDSQNPRRHPDRPTQHPENLMGDNDDIRGIKLDAHNDARAIIRLVQCSQCSHPMKFPMTLPCGNSICRTCIPATHVRENISWPNTPSRQRGFQCPLPDCMKEHTLDDCGYDVTLSKVLDTVSLEIVRCREAAGDSPILLQRQSKTTTANTEKPSSPQEYHGGRLVATYTMAEEGLLEYSADLLYLTPSEKEEEYRNLDVVTLEQLKEATRVETDCHVCYGVFLDPLTTSCGHTFCRPCLMRVLDHSSVCPVCRRELYTPPSLSSHSGNLRLNDILKALCPELLAARAELLAQEESGIMGELNMPLFVCTLAYPAMPTFLHIFEPRYRLMIRRAVDTGNRKFGMVMYNRTGAAQGELGRTNFLEFGTLLHVVNFEMLPDGRSLIETIGVSRFRVQQWGMLDGYTVANIERIDDIPIADEERLEATETSTPPAAPHDLNGQLDRMSTQALLEIGINFVSLMQRRAAPWLHERVLAAYGLPPEDPALFPYWFASILPIADDEKYKLLPTTSVRERLKITARWVRRMEGTRVIIMNLIADSDDEPE